MSSQDGLLGLVAVKRKYSTANIRPRSPSRENLEAFERRLLLETRPVCVVVTIHASLVSGSSSMREDPCRGGPNAPTIRLIQLDLRSPRTATGDQLHVV